MATQGRELLVIGGGPAGLAAAIAASRRGRRVALCESASYGRDKVCGEFLSPEVVEDFAALGCADWIETLRPAPLRDVLLTAPGGARLGLRLPGPPAWGLTRRAMEGFLAGRARAAGAAVHERSPVRALARDGAGWRFQAAEGEGRTDALVCAFGKRSSLDRPLELPRSRSPEAFAAAKAYFDAPASEVLEADVELHLVPGGYVGLNAVEGGRLALCALLDGDATSDWTALADRFAASPELAARLRRAGAPSGAVRGLAKFGFRAQKLHHAGALLCGDAARMMPSFTGDGMAVALRSGRLASAALDARDPPGAYAASYRAEFSRRLFFANLLHRAFFNPVLFAAIAPLLDRRPSLTQRVYEWTRGRAA